LNQTDPLPNAKEAHVRSVYFVWLDCTGFPTDRLHLAFLALTAGNALMICKWLKS
jgi:hypothetical protein